MKRFAALLDRLSYTAGRNAKLKLIVDYLRDAPDPDRGYALGVFTDELSFAHAKPRLARQLISARVDPHLFALSYDYVGDLSETVALLWPAPQGQTEQSPSLSQVVEGLQNTSSAKTAAMLALWLDGLDETGRWALLKLVTGSLRVGVSARLAKTALAILGARDVEEIEEVWPGQQPPYADVFAWLEGRRARPQAALVSFKSPMLAHPLDEEILADLDPAELSVEWKWDGVRVQALGDVNEVAGARIFSRAGEDITRAFPDVARALRIPGMVMDGELLIVKEGRVAPFGALQQRLNRKTVTSKLMADLPAHIRAYDLLAIDGQDLRSAPFCERRARLEQVVAAHAGDRLDISPLAAVTSRADIAAARRQPANFGGGSDSGAIEGVMLKRKDSPYVSGRPRGLWWKWKRDPMSVDAVLMYAQRGHGKRSSFYSDYTFGVWRDGALTPVGKAYSGFTDGELKEIDRFVRNNTVKRFGPVREVRCEPDFGLVMEIYFEGLNRSTRNKSGLAMRFPRIARLRWDKKPSEAGVIEELESLLNSEALI